MVDDDLLLKIRDIYEAKSIGENPENFLTIYELVKQFIPESEDVQEELEDIDEFSAQLVINDKEFRYWVTIGGGKFEYGKGDAKEPSFTMSCNLEIMAGLMSGDLDGTSAYMAGDLSIEGNLQDAIAYGEFLGLVMEEFRDAYVPE
jgi:putative sterol carrier protein